MASLVATTEEEKPTTDDTATDDTATTTSGDHDLDINQMENIDRQKFLYINTEKEDKFDTFVDWIQSNGGNFPKLYLKKYDEANRGVHASEIIHDDECVMEIPYACVFTVEMGKATDTGKIVVSKNIEGRFDAPKHIYLMLFLLIDGENEDSFFQPYYKILPGFDGNVRVGLSGMPIFWSEEEYGYLKGSYLLQQCQMRKDAIRRDYDEIVNVDPSFSRFSLDRFAWARMIVCSRNFGGMINGTRSSGMVPMADMLNHYRPRETRWGFDEDSKMFTIHSCCEIGVGDSVYDSYGKKCQHRFLLNYGFSIENNREPDGRNPNQLHMIFDLLPDDDALNIKHMLLEQCLNVSRDQTRRGIRVSTVYTEKTTTEAFSYLRFIHMTDHELMPLFPRCQVSGLNQTHVFGWLRGKCSKVVVPHPFFFLSSSFSCFSFFFSVWSMGHYT
jgi:histone-lysine N-methyltransferase SETD3